MSMFQTEQIECPACGSNVPFDVVYSVNAVLRPDLRSAILDRTFQREACGECGHSFRVEPEMTYLDMKNKQWILVRPFTDLQEWGQMEAYARTFFEAAFGPEAPGPSQALGRNLQVRVTFGWPAVREKVLCADLGLNDVELELLKFSLLRSVDNPPLSDTTELRLLGSQSDKLALVWLNVENEEPKEVMNVPRGLYNEIAADKTGWKQLRDELSAGPFIDMRRLLVPVEAT